MMMTLVMLAGCSDCQEPVLDRMEESLRSDPVRSGKVGTLQALEVSQEARKIAEDVAIRAEGPCDIGWTVDESFSMTFELEIEVRRGNWRRRWEERGQWTQDDRGRWEITGEADFQDGDHSAGQRRYHVFSDEQGFWERLGPDSMARHQSRSIEARWRQEFGGRFSELMNLISTGWQRAGEQSWVPGEQPATCGPRSAGTALSWRPILSARGQRRQARIELYQGEGEKRCRRIQADYRLEGGGQLSVELSECVGANSTALHREMVKEVVEVERSRQDAVVARQLQEWIEEGIVEIVERN